MFERLLWRGLSSKLLIITIIFIMLAEIVIFIPSATLFRQNWLEERAKAVGLLTLAIEGVPDFENSEILSLRFMQDTDVIMVAQKREGRSQLVLGMPPNAGEIYIVDLRVRHRLPLFRETFRDFFMGNSGYLRILAAPTVTGADTLEILVPRAALKRDLEDYCHRVLLWSLTISLLTGLMIYLTLSHMIVRPIQKLGKNLAAFRNDPRKRLRTGKPPLRYDEIGHLEREFVDMKEGVRQAFEQQERLATLGMAMAKINHDLRNILSSAQLISDRLATDPEERVRHVGERLVKAVDRGVKLCHATLSFSQSVEEKPEPRNTRLATLIGEVAGNAMAKEGKVTFKNEVPRKMEIIVDPDQAYRIFHNLFLNAVQAMKGRKNRILGINTEIRDDKVLIRVRDTGPGLPQKTKDNLFKAFTSAVRKGGTGLGLTISRELARANGGNLQLESTDENGTVFVVSLPLTG